MMGWIVAAAVNGFVVGAVVGAWLMYRWLPRGLVRLPQPVAAAPATVYAPVEPEALAQQLLNEDVQQRMVADFQQSYGASLDDAKLAVEDTLRQVRRLGAETTW